MQACTITANDSGCSCTSDMLLDCLSPTEISVQFYWGAGTIPDPADVLLAPVTAAAARLRHQKDVRAPTEDALTRAHQQAKPSILGP